MQCESPEGKNCMDWGPLKGDLVPLGPNKQDKTQNQSREKKRGGREGRRGEKEVVKKETGGREKRKERGKEERILTDA